jgi:hypothetical protein
MKKLLIIILLCYNSISAQTLCDSLSYSIGNNQELTLISINNSTDSTNFMWGVCDSDHCYSGSGDTAVFANVNFFDTVKVCYDISPQWTCNDCFYVVFNGFTWQLVNTITYISELKPQIHNGKTYDLLGREIYHIPKGVIYIKNGVLYR